MQNEGMDEAQAGIKNGRRNINSLSVLAWRIPGMGEPGGLPSMGSHRVGHDGSGLAAAVLLKYPARVKAGSLKCTVLCN